MNIKERITQSRLIKAIVNTIFYFETGKTQIARIYGWVPDLFIILGGLRLLFNVKLTNLQMVFLIVLFAGICYNVGYFLKHAGLYDVDLIVKAKQNPVMDTVYRAAKHIVDSVEVKK